MGFSYTASITDTNDAIPAAINSAVNSAVSTLSARITSLETEASSLEARIAALESGNTPDPEPEPEPTPVDAFVASKTVLQLGNAASPKAVAKPSDVQAGDLLLMIVSVDWGTATNLTPSTGFTQLTEVDLGTDRLKYNVAYKVAGSSEPATYNVGVTSATDARVDLLAIRNANTSGTIAVQSTKVLDSTAKTSVDAPSVTPSSSRGLLISTAAASKSSVAEYSYSFTPPTGMTEISDAATGNWVGMATATQTYNSSSATGVKTFGLTTSASRVEKIGINLVVPSAN